MMLVDQQLKRTLRYNDLVSDAIRVNDEYKWKLQSKVSSLMLLYACNAKKD